MVRQTSIDTYNKINSGNYLSNRRKEVYNFIYEHGPCTGRFVNKNLCTQLGNNSSSFLSRITELTEMLAICEVGTTYDSETHQTVSLYMTTNNIPIPFKNKKTKFQIKLEQELIKERRRCAKIASKWSEIAAQEIMDLCV